MSKVWSRGFVLVLAAASLAAVGCSSGGDGGVRMLEADVAELEMLRDELVAAKAAVEKQAADEKVARQAVETELATERVARQTAETNVAVQTVLVAERTARLNEAQAAKLKAEEDLAAARKALEKAQTDATANVTVAAQQVALLRAQVRTLTEEVATLKEKLKTAQAEIDTATDTPTHPGLLTDATDTTTTPPPTTTQPTSTESVFEENTRGLQLLAALDIPLGDDPPAFSVTNPNPKAYTIEVVGSRTVIKSTTFTSKGTPPRLAGFDSVRLEQDVGLAKEALVVYTDIEKNRTLFDHYGAMKGNTAITVPPDERTAINVRTGTRLYGIASLSLTDIPSSIPAVENVDPMRTVMVTAPTGSTIARLSGRLRNVSGQFSCEGTDNAICSLTAVGTYADTNNSPTHLELVTLALTTDGNTVKFQPTSGRIPLDGTQNKTGVNTNTATPGNLRDEAYIAFGWWMKTPDQADEDYGFRVFADVWGEDGIDAGNGSPVASATYRGPAAGMYVERDLTDKITHAGQTHPVTEYGTFTATAILTVDDSRMVDGVVSDFKTKNGVELWQVNLISDLNASLTLGAGDTPGVGGVETSPLATAGKWEAKYMAASDNQAAAAVGRFDAELGDVLHLTGAFGAYHQKEE